MNQKVMSIGRQGFANILVVVLVVVVAAVAGYFVLVERPTPTDKPWIEVHDEDVNFLGVVSLYPRVAYEGESKYWWGGDDGGIFSLTKKDHAFEAYGKIGDIVLDNVSDVVEWDGNVWVGLHNVGVLRFNLTTRESRLYGRRGEEVFAQDSPYTQKEGIASNYNIRFVPNKEQSELWIETFKGPSFYIKETDSWISFGDGTGPVRNDRAPNIKKVIEDALKKKFGSLVLFPRVSIVDGAGVGYINHEKEAYFFDPFSPGFIKNEALTSAKLRLLEKLKNSETVSDTTYVLNPLQCIINPSWKKEDVVFFVLGELQGETISSKAIYGFSYSHDSYYKILDLDSLEPFIFGSETEKYKDSVLGALRYGKGYPSGPLFCSADRFIFGVTGGILVFDLDTKTTHYTSVTKSPSKPFRITIGPNVVYFDTWDGETQFTLRSIDRVGRVEQLDIAPMPIEFLSYLDRMSSIFLHGTDGSTFVFEDHRVIDNMQSVFIYYSADRTWQRFAMPSDLEVAGVWKGNLFVSGPCADPSFCDGKRIGPNVELLTNSPIKVFYGAPNIGLHMTQNYLWISSRPRTAIFPWVYMAL